MSEEIKTNENLQDENNKQHSKKFKFKRKRKSLQNSIKSDESEQNLAQAQKDETKTAKKKKNKNLPTNLTGNEPWQVQMARSIEENKIIHEQRLYPLKFTNSTEHKFKIIFGTELMRSNIILYI